MDTKSSNYNNNDDHPLSNLNKKDGEVESLTSDHGATALMAVQIDDNTSEVPLASASDNLDYNEQVLENREEASGQSRPLVRDCVIKMLDEMDERVEKLRSAAMKLENERDDVLSSLDTFLNTQMIYDLDAIDVDEITRYIERLARRCMTVHIDITTDRSSVQLEALHKVNNLIDAMIREMKRDALAARRMCLAYINSCSEQLSKEHHSTDSVFENAVLGCTIEDQKRIKKRLHGLYTYFKAYNRSTSLPEEMEDLDDVDVKSQVEFSNL